MKTGFKKIISNILFLIKSFLFLILYFFLKRYYKIKIATKDEEKEKIFEFRYKIYREELEHYFLDDKTSKKSQLMDDSDFDEHSVLVYSGDVHNITGTIKFTVWNIKDIPPSIINKYGITHQIVNSAYQIGEIRFLQVKKQYRHSFLAVCLMAKLYEVMTIQNKMISDIVFCDCQPGLLKPYQSLGGFPYTFQLIDKDFGILFIPLMITPFDFCYHYKIKNIFYLHAKKSYLKIKKNVPLSIANKIARDYSLSITRLSFQYTLQKMQQFLPKMKTELARENAKFIFSLLKYFTVLTLQPGMILIKSGIVDYDVFFLLEGSLEIHINTLVITTLEPGLIIGEMALLNSLHKRYVDVVCKERSKVLLIPRNILYSLEKRNKKLAIHFLHMLCNNLIDKLSKTNKLIKESPDDKINNDPVK